VFATAKLLIQLDVRHEVRISESLFPIHQNCDYINQLNFLLEFMFNFVKEHLVSVFAVRKSWTVNQCQLNLVAIIPVKISFDFDLVRYRFVTFLCSEDVVALPWI